jgi:hypothetical protein
MRNYKALAAQQAAARRKKEIADALDSYRKVRERSIKKIIEQTCEKAQIPYMRNRDIKLVQTRDGKIIPAPIGDSQRGKPDLTVVALDGHTIWIETKAHDGKLEPEQIEWRDKLIKRGHEYHAPRTIEEAHSVSKRILEAGR